MSVEPGGQEPPDFASEEEEALDQTFSALLASVNLPATPTRAAVAFSLASGAGGATSGEVRRVRLQLLPPPRSSSLHPPQETVVPEDWVRNFLFRVGMTRTAECFEAEWCEVRRPVSPSAPSP